MKGGAKRSADELRDLAIEASRLIYEENMTARQAMEMLQRNGHEVRGERDVRRLAQRARDPSNPLVRVRVEPVEQPSAEELQDLAVSLMKASGLRSVLITRSPLSNEKDFSSSDERQRRRAYTDSDQLHYRLGRLAAQHLWDRVRDGDILAVGGGRAPGYTVEWLERMVQPGWRLDHVEVVSLAARFGEKEWGNVDVQRKLDADDLTDRLGKIVANDYKAWPVEFALASQPTREDSKLLSKRAPQIVGETWDEPATPELAVFGVSTVIDGHPLLTRNAFTKGIEPILERAQQQLSGEARLADVCNHYWVVGDERDDNYGEQCRIAEALNKVCIAIAPSKLALAKDKVLVAGGAQKYPAILSLLEGGDNLPKPTTLVTDQAIAERLLSALRRSPS
jgi:DNA-binding transcriptional regulator LsrR (DeoR family)